MTSKIEICNLALGNIGQSSIQDFDEDSAEAAACRDRYDQALRSCLSAIWWTFSKKVVTLALASSSEADEWTYRYQRPTDCVAGRYIVDPTGRWTRRIRFEIAGQEIWTDQKEAKFAYTRFVDDPSYYTAPFVDALSWRLGADLVMPLSLDRSIRSDSVQLFRQAIAIAGASDANEQDPYDMYERDAAWVEAR